MKKKAIWGIVIGLVVIAACFVVIFTRNQKQTVTKQGKQQDQVGLSIKKTKHNKQSNNSTQNDNQDSDEQYSTDEWMLMGYMAYCHNNYVQSRHIKNNAELVDDVSEDLGDGSLKAVKNSYNSYTLTNKFGSVDVDVEDDDVKVTGDGDTVNAKSELKNKFGAYADKVKAMTKNISNGGNTEEVSDKNDKDNQSDTTIPNFTIKQLAVLAGFTRVGKKWVKECIKATEKPESIIGTMCVGYDTKKDNYYLSGHGDGTTIVIFKREGNVLVTKHNELTGPSVGASPDITKRTPLTQIVNKYYSTSEERAEVDGLANRLLNSQQYDKKMKEYANK